MRVARAVSSPAWRRRSRATRTSPSSSSCSPTCSSSRATTRSACSPTAARPRGSARRGGSVAQLALDGKAKELPGIGKTIEEKIVQIVETGEIEALTKRRKHDPARGGRVHAPPGPRAEDGAPDLAGARRHDARRAARGRRGSSGCARSPGSAPKTEENILKALGRKQKADGPAARAARARRCRRCSRSSRSCASTRPPTGSPRRAARAAAGRPSATSTSSRPRPTRPR